MKEIAKRLLRLAIDKRHNDYGYDERLTGLQNAYVHMMIGEVPCRTWEDIADHLKDWFHDTMKFPQGCDSNYKAVSLLKKYIREYPINIMTTE